MKNKRLRFKKGQEIVLLHRKTGKRRTVTFLQQYGDKLILVNNEVGKGEVIQLLEYILIVLPLIERIIIWFRRMFKRKRKR